MGLFDQDPPPDAAPSDSDESPATDPSAPLADRMRPRTLDEFVGQTGVVGPGSALRRAIERDEVRSIVLWGPPGCGKTTLARLIASRTQARFVAFSAVLSGVKEARAIMETARRELRATGRRTILFVDEIHRFNRAQQDAFLPAVERGTIVLIGATTENPSFEVNSALLSRSRVFRLERLGDDDLAALLRRALADAERGLGDRGVVVSDERLAAIARQSQGDARAALNGLDAAVAAATAAGASEVGDELLRDALQRATLYYDRAGEEHFNLISALHKSMRDSDPDASLYWLARMLRSGEDPLYTARRIVRFASEDVGLADPDALRVAVDAWQSVHFLGMPEGALALAEAAVYCALAPKSNAVYVAWNELDRAIDEGATDPVPLHLRNAVSGLMRREGYGDGYRYAHDDPDAVTGMDCLPERLRGRTFYRPSGRGFERELVERIRARRAARDERRGREDD